MPLEVLIVLLFLLVFPAFWIGVLVLISRFGWAELAEHWQTTTHPHGEHFALTSARIGLSNYNGVLELWISESGICLEPIWLFRAAHPRLFIPWQDVEDMRDFQWFWQSGKQLQLKNQKSLILFGRGVRLLNSSTR